MTQKHTPDIEAALAAVDDLSDGSKHDWRRFAHSIAAAYRQAEAIIEANNIYAKNLQKDGLLFISRAEKAEAELADEKKKHRESIEAYSDTLADARKERDLALAQLGEAREALGKILRNRSFDLEEKECRMCGAGKAGFHYDHCPRTIAFMALSRTPAKEPKEEI